LMAAAGINWVVDQTYDEGPKALLEAVKLCYERMAPAFAKAGLKRPPRKG